MWCGEGRGARDRFQVGGRGGPSLIGIYGDRAKRGPAETPGERRVSGRHQVRDQLSVPPFCSVVLLLLLRQYYIYSVFHFLYITLDGRKGIWRDQTSRAVQIVTGEELLPGRTVHILKIARVSGLSLQFCWITFQVQFLHADTIHAATDWVGSLGVIRKSTIEFQLISTTEKCANGILQQYRYIHTTKRFEQFVIHFLYQIPMCV